MFSLFDGCDYLDMVPENDIETIETIFEKREQAEEWFKKLSFLSDKRDCFCSNESCLCRTDEIVTGQYVRQTYPLSNVYCWDGLFIGDGLQMSQSPMGIFGRLPNFIRLSVIVISFSQEQIEKCIT